MAEIKIDLDQIQEDKKVAGYWYGHVPEMRKFRKVSTSKMRQLGLKSQDIRMVRDFDELKMYPPNIIVAQATTNVSFVQNFFKTQTLKKRQKYVMGLGVYQQLHKSVENKKVLLKPTTPQFKNVYRPYEGQSLEGGKSILVFRTGGIGDLLFINPNLRYLKDKYPDCVIKFACGPQYQAMVENWKGELIDELLDLPFTLQDLQSSDYHVLFEGVIERCKLSHHQNSYNLFSRWIGLDLDDELLVPHQEPKWDLVEEVEEILADWKLDKKDYIVMQLRASSPIRTPSPKFFGELISKLVDAGHKVVLTDSKRNAEQLDSFIKDYITSDQSMVYNFSPHSESLDYTIALTYNSKCVCATDSALNHIAASMDVPCYGIYGPFPGFIRLKTYPKADWVDGTLPCSPCFLHGHRPCPQAGSDGASPCYDQIDKDRVVKKIGELIEQ
jgi:ADP-heptose:LPS heptosyltransferase